MVELHGGRVLIDTAPREGTTVTCIFPVDPIAPAASPRLAASQSQAAQ
jgi:signal transduction histidine kinase